MNPKDIMHFGPLNKTSDVVTEVTSEVSMTFTDAQELKALKFISAGNMQGIRIESHDIGFDDSTVRHIGTMTDRKQLDNLIFSLQQLSKQMQEFEKRK